MAKAQVELKEVTGSRATSEGRDQANWSTGEAAHIVILKSGEGYFGIDINIVQEIVLMQDITKVPGSANYIAGMTDLRGRVIPVTEFATLLGHEPSERSEDTRILVVEHGTAHIGFIVDAVTEVMLVEGDKIEGATSAGASDHDYIVGVAKLDGNLVALVNTNSLLASSGAGAELEAIAEAA